MPMYYFHLRDQDTLTDVDGTELPDDRAARTHAAGVARELMSRSGGILGEDWESWTMVVHDAAGDEVVAFAMSDMRGDGTGAELLRKTIARGRARSTRR